MNWKEIKEKYPKAYQEWELWGDQHCIKDIPDINYRWPEIPCTLRRLYDFFDDHLIFIHTCTGGGFGIVYIWDWYIHNCINKAEDEDFESTESYKSRAESESESFIQAFEILEKKLTN